MADLVPPVRPLVKHAKALEAALRREFLRPMYHSFAEPLARATAAAQAFVVMDQVVEAIQGLPRNGVPLELIQKHLDTLEGYHRERVGKVFQSALGVNVRQLLTRPAVAAFMAERLGENVALISTIPQRFHDGLRSRLAQALTEKPFDRSLLTKVVGEEFKASGYQLRRIVRDQTTKAIGGLTEIRQKQLGIEKYQWLTVGDTRVRELHQANGGNYFLWADPPAGTGHPGTDVQCRCVAIAVMSSLNRDRLAGRDPAVPKPKSFAPPRPPPQPSKATNKPDLDDAGPVPVQEGDPGPLFTIPTEPPPPPA